MPLISFYPLMRYEWLINRRNTRLKYWIFSGYKHTKFFLVNRYLKKNPEASHWNISAKPLEKHSGRFYHCVCVLRQRLCNSPSCFPLIPSLSSFWTYYLKFFAFAPLSSCCRHVWSVLAFQCLAYIKSF